MSNLKHSRCRRLRDRVQNYFWREAEAVTYTLYYTSADTPGEDATWSVYREQYAAASDDEPIEGSQEWVSTHSTEAEADTEARRLQKESS